MPGQVHRHKRQSTLGVRAALESCACSIELRDVVRIGTKRFLLDYVQALVVRDEEVIDVAWRGLETLRAVPGHVLDGEKGAIGEEKEVEHAVADDDIVGALDDGG